MTSEAVRPLQHTDFMTTDPDEAHDFLGRTYSDVVVRARGPAENFRMRHRQLRAGDLSIATGQHTMAIDYACEALGGLIVVRVLAGEVERETAGETSRLRSGDVFILSRPEDVFAVRWNTVRAQVVRIDEALLSEVAELDGDGSHRVRFTGLDTLSPVEARHWRVTADYAVASLSGAHGALASPLVVGSAARMLAAATLGAFPNTALDATTSPDLRFPNPGTAAAGVPAARRPDTSAAMLRRVIAVMEERAHEDVSVVDLAGAAWVSPAELREVFRRHLASSPGAYLQQIRLDRAHAELLYPDPDRDVTVLDVAHRWGFADLRTFTAAYTAAYGRSPEEAVTAGPRGRRGRSSPSRGR